MKFVFTSVFLFLIHFGVAHAGSEDNHSKIEKISALYLGRPYKVDPLGEGRGYDKDPLYRLDAFDCMTYVETVIAQALANDFDQFVELMKEIRYKNGQVNFVLRNHFTNIDWIKNNQKNGLITDITRKLFPTYTLTSEIQIDKAAWFKKKYHLQVDLPLQISRLDYIPLDSLLQNPKLLQKIPSGSIINIVRSGWIDISHQGFAILGTDGIFYFRHASLTRKKVTQVSLLNYLIKIKRVKKVKGINVLRIN
jgi:hypothetical protein